MKIIAQNRLISSLLDSLEQEKKVQNQLGLGQNEVSANDSSFSSLSSGVNSLLASLEEETSAANDEQQVQKSASSRNKWDENMRQNLQSNRSARIGFV